MRLLRYALPLLLIALPVQAQGTCFDGTTGIDTLTCSVTPSAGGNLDDQIDGDLGDDTIHVLAGVSLSHIEGDGRLDGSLENGNPRGVGNGGHDTIVNEGNVLVYSVNGDGGNDTITNKGQAASGIVGDASNGNGGSDRLTNNGYAGRIVGDGVDGAGGADIISNLGVTGEILGDSAGDGGADNITNTGTVERDIRGDMVMFNMMTGTIGQGRADIIINAGAVGGAIYGEDGDDTIILRNGANGGADRLLVIDGGNGVDTLRFEFTNNRIKQQIRSAISQSAGGSGSVTVNGQTFQWTNIEHVEVGR
jgi:hypothetical protein